MPVARQCRGVGIASFQPFRDVVSRGVRDRVYAPFVRVSEPEFNLKDASNDTLVI